MKKHFFCLAAFLTLPISGSASAGLIEVSVIAGPNQHPDGNHNTWQVIARFTDQGDQISNVNGLDQDGFNALDFFTTGGELYNQALFGGLPLNDFPSVGLGGEAYDSYVTIGNTSFPSNVRFTPNFLGDWGGGVPTEAVIVGSQWHETDGAWLFFGTPPEVGSLPDAVEGNETYDIVIAQFTIDSGQGFHLSGNIQWFNPVSGANNTPFLAEVYPTPGVLALFGIAGFIGIRRRREL